MRARTARVMRAPVPTRQPAIHRTEAAPFRAPVGPAKRKETPNMAQKTPATMAVIFLATSASLARCPGMIGVGAPDGPGDVAVEGYQAGYGVGEGFPLGAELLELAVDLVVDFN